MLRRSHLDGASLSSGGANVLSYAAALAFDQTLTESKADPESITIRVLQFLKGLYRYAGRHG
jgi:hypothetical protein